MKKKDKKKRKKRAASAQRAISTAREAVARAGQKLEDRLATFERVADGLEQAAVERFQSLAVRELKDDQLLRDLADLQSAFASVAPGGLPGGIEPFRHLPEALLRWLQARFGLTPYLEAGREMQIPSEKLEGFALSGDRDEAPDGLLVRLKILAPGWKRGKEIVVPPRAELMG